MVDPYPSRHVRCLCSKPHFLFMSYYLLCVNAICIIYYLVFNIYIYIYILFIIYINYLLCVFRAYCLLCVGFVGLVMRIGRCCFMLI